VEIDAFPDTTFIGRVVRISHSSVRGTGRWAATDQAIDYEVIDPAAESPRDDATRLLGDGQDCHQHA
jgi:HlyD family secretion protein